MLTALIEKNEVRTERRIAEIHLDSFYRITLDRKEFNKRHSDEFRHEDDDESLEFAADSTFFWHLIDTHTYYDPFAEFDEDCCHEKYQKALSVIDHNGIHRDTGNVYKMYGVLTRTSPDNKLMLSAYFMSCDDGTSFQMYLNVPLHLVPRLEKELVSPKAPKFATKGLPKKVPATSMERLVFNVFLPSLIFTETNDQIQLN